MKYTLPPIDLMAVADKTKSLVSIRTKKFESHDPYHPYHAYGMFDLAFHLGKDRKGSKDGVL
jgi:hypothetical protein